DRGDPALLRSRVWPLPLPDPQHHGRGGLDAGWPFATGNDRPVPPAALPPREPPRGSRQRERRSRLLPGPRDRPPVVGTRCGRPELPRALAIGGPGALR